jgi:thioredoxin 1
MSRVIEITDATFEREVLRASTPVMLDLWGDWCEPCKTLDPLVREIARSYAGKMKVCRLDVGANPRRCSSFARARSSASMSAPRGRPT